MRMYSEIAQAPIKSLTLDEVHHALAVCPDEDIDLWRKVLIIKSLRVAA